MRGLAECLVDRRVERDDAAGELATNTLGVLKLLSGDRQCAGKTARDLGRKTGEQCPQPASRTTQIGSSEDDAGADNADADLARTIDGEHEGLSVQPPGRAELVQRDDRGRIASQRRGVSREIAQQ
ncbi:MAG: hypothetical protein JOZ26_23055, partial [Hyphomicrobiales bacterium]|nr:hypothetical protein [Hyphomicrobiales bacterium]